MKPTKCCNCIRCTDCQHYAECIEYKIETEQARGKCSFGKLKMGTPLVVDNNLKT